MILAIVKNEFTGKKVITADTELAAQERVRELFNFVNGKWLREHGALPPECWEDLEGYMEHPDEYGLAPFEAELLQVEISIL